MKARIYITLKNGVLDPQGRAIHHSLESLGFAGVQDVRQANISSWILPTAQKKRRLKRCAASCWPIP